MAHLDQYLQDPSTCISAVPARLPPYRSRHPSSQSPQDARKIGHWMDPYATLLPSVQREWNPCPIYVLCLFDRLQMRR
jgi:hypothetical protein